MPKLTKRQLDVIVVVSAVQAAWAKEDELKESCEQVINQGRHDWRTDCLRALHGLKRAAPLIAHAKKGLDSISVSDWINHGGTIQITIEATWGTIEYELKASKRLIALRTKIDEAEQALHRINRDNRGRRARTTENMIRGQLRHPGERAAKARRTILRALAELLKPEDME